MPQVTRNRSALAQLVSVTLVCACLVCAILSPHEQASTFNTPTKAQQLTNTQLQDQTEARQAIERGDTLSALWTKTSLQEAINEYEKAALLSTSASDSASASQANLKSGDLHFILSKYTEALQRYQNAETFARKANDWLLTANALSCIGRVNSFRGKNDLAQQQLTQALELFKQHDANLSDVAANAYGEALTNLAEVSYAMGDFVNAREQLKSALEVFRNDPKGEAKAHLFNGYITGSIGDAEKAVAEINLALELYRKANDKIGEGIALSTLGLSYSLKRDVTRATELHNQGIDIFRAVGDRYDEAVAINSLGQAYEGINDYALAISQYEQSLQLFEEIGSPDGMSVATFKLGRVHNLNKQPDKALAFYQRCLQLSRAAGKVRTEANALNAMARVYLSQGRRDLAQQQFLKLQKFYQTIGDLQGQAIALNTYGDFLLQSGEDKKALDAWQRALQLSEKVGNKGILISTLYSLARVNLKTGSPDVALSFIRRSLEIIEDLRANVASPDFRVSYLSDVGKHYGLCIDILMTLDRLYPEKGFAADALLVSEKGRARLLLDLVNESRANWREGSSQTLLDRELELRGLFRAQAQYRMDLVLSKKDSSEIEVVDKQLAQFRGEYQQIQAQLRQEKHVTASAPLTLQQIQNELRTDDTMLLEYSLGEEHSHLWAVTSNTLQSYELPSRKILEDAAREVYALLTARQSTEGPQDENYQAKVEAADDAYTEKATRLSQMLLGPLAQQLGSRRLLVVTEGALQHIPLEALLIPDSTSRTFLIESNEAVALPSVSTLIAIRNGRNRTSSPNKLVAVIADPVLSNTDDRVQSQTGFSGTALAASDNRSESRTRSAGLARLTHASEEADAISAVAPRGTTFLAKGFDATRETAMSQDIGQYQIVHFATHGVLDSEHPELSGIVLSSVDRTGKTTNGLMPLHDIYSLHLSSELTVLSACQTALGKDIKGEGLIGLTHSFMSAGTNTVVASLWKVDDRATAVLMADFYESMLQRGMSPSSALRSAKMKLMRDKRWSAPYYWAGFVLQGEYTNHITVTRHPWLRTGLVLMTLLILLAATLLIVKRRFKVSTTTR